MEETRLAVLDAADDGRAAALPFPPAFPLAPSDASYAPLSESFIRSGDIVSSMGTTKARFRRIEAARREVDVILEALSRRTQTPEESLRALEVHNAAVLRMNQARR
ncbi:MAG TPA: hypothetical protein VEY12_10795 [Thermoplasmata archaeon]|nr:hypothetical protein [Thermoplasmata archaeon]